MKSFWNRLSPPWGRHSDKWPPLLAFGVVIVALGALTVIPAVLLHRVAEENQKVNRIILSAEAGVRELAFAREERMAVARRSLLVEDPRYARAMAAAEAAELEALDDLERLAPQMSAAFTDHVRGLRIHVARRNSLEAVAAQRGGGVDVYRRMVPQFQAVRDSVAVHLSGLQHELVQAAADRQAQDQGWAELQRTISVLLGTLALLAALIVGWFALRQRRLVNEIQRALQAENRLRALADERTRELEAVMASRVRLMQGITHDVKNPLSAAKGYADLLEMGTPVPMRPEQAPLMAGVRRSVDGALAIITDLLDLARIDAGGLAIHCSDCDIRDVVRPAAEDYRPAAEAAGHAIELLLPKEPVRVHTDPARVTQVLGNLVSNAIKYTPPPGRIVVQCELVRGEEAWATVRVSDSGAGIPEDQREEIFNEFRRLDEAGGQSGHGLGLAIARRIARLIGGDLMIDHTVTTGASFVLHLPLRVNDRCWQGSASEAKLTQRRLSATLPDSNQRGNVSEYRLGSTVLELAVGDIAAQEGFDAVVNAANAELRTGGGVAGALHRAAGPGLETETRPLAPIRPGEAVITSGHRLPNVHVIHCLGPVYGVDEPSDQLLASCYREALGLAEEGGLRSIAFPAISTGAFGYPMEPAARIAFQTVCDRAEDLQSVKRIRFVLHDEDALALHRRVLDEVIGAQG